MRAEGLATIFSNPGSTEVAFLRDLPGDFRFVLGLHEGAVVGMATGWALAHGMAAVLLHTTAGLGNAVGALATARVNRAAMVVVVGQQDRRHLAYAPFLAGQLSSLAGPYPVRVEEPPRAADVPGAIGRAIHAARAHRGPALVIVPMDDWHSLEDVDRRPPAADVVVASAGADRECVDALVDFVDAATAPALVVGAGAAHADVWTALVAVAESRGMPVWQEAFGARPGFPQDHPLFAGHLPSDRGRLRATLAGHDAVLVVGGPAFRQYPYAEGDFVASGTAIATITEDADEAHGAAADLAVHGPLAATCAAVARRLGAGVSLAPAPAAGALPAPGDVPVPADGPLRAVQVLAELAARLPHDVVLIEEAPSHRRDLARLLPARTPLGFVSAAMGGLGFGLPAAIGLRMALPGRGVVAIVGDGSLMYAVQALWSAAQYDVGLVCVVLDNGGYAIMDHLAAAAGGHGPWPALAGLHPGLLAQGCGCAWRRVEDLATLRAVLDDELVGLAHRTAPLLIDAVVATGETIEP